MKLWSRHAIAHTSDGRSLWVDGMSHTYNGRSVAKIIVISECTVLAAHFRETVTMLNVTSYKQRLLIPIQLNNHNGNPQLIKERRVLAGCVKKLNGSLMKPALQL